MPVEQQGVPEMGSEPSTGTRPTHGGWGERIAWTFGSAVFVTFCSLICTAITILFLWNIAKTQDIGMSALLVPLQGVVTIPVGYLVSVAYVIKKASDRDGIVHNKRARSAAVGAVLPIVAVVIAGAVYTISESNRPTVVSYVVESEQAVDLLRAELPITGGSSSVSWQGTGLGICELDYSEAIGTLKVRTSDLRPQLLHAEELLVADGFTTSRVRTTAEPITSTLVAYRADRLVEVAVVLDEETDGFGEMYVASFAGPCVEWRGENYLESPPSRRGLVVSGWQLEPQPPISEDPDLDD